MKTHVTASIYLISVFFLMGCQSISGNFHSPAYYKNKLLPLSSAVQVSYQDEVNILRLNQILADKNDLNLTDRARLLYERGLIYDRMGLEAHSRYNLNLAITADPTFAPAYNILGLYFLINNSYDEAFEAFDSAIELSDKMEYSYLHRAMGLYQVQRYSLASKNIELFYALDPGDPYRVIWRYIINSQIDLEFALSQLSNAKKLNQTDSFVLSLIDVMANRITEQRFFNAISSGIYNNEALAQRLCEAYFYLGEWHKIAGNTDLAIHYFKSATAGNIHEFIEYKYALLELASIQTTRVNGSD